MRGCFAFAISWSQRDADNPVCVQVCLQTKSLQAGLPASLVSMSALIRLIDASKRYGDAAALHPTNLSIERGKTTVVIGPSGCGKSTLLRLIIRLIEPDSGRIDFNGEVIRPDNIDVLRHRIGYVIQEGGL